MIFLGTADRKVKIWNASTGLKVTEFDTENQVSGIIWNQEHREVITAGGYPNNALRVWKYPKFDLIKEIHNAKP